MLPTLTEVSRASLLCGALRGGGQDAERDGFAALARAHGLAGAPLFHKRPLDSTRPGLRHRGRRGRRDRRRRTQTPGHLRAEQRSTTRSTGPIPAGPRGEPTTVKHLRPLLDRARNAGRDGHPHRRPRARHRAPPGDASARTPECRAAGPRPATPPAGDGEILVSGHRVLLHDGTAVLAVDENLRYGPLKSGYHGGAFARRGRRSGHGPGAGRGSRGCRPGPRPAAGTRLVARPGYGRACCPGARLRTRDIRAFGRAHYEPLRDHSGPSQAPGRDDGDVVRRARSRYPGQRARIPACGGTLGRAGDTTRLTTAESGAARVLKSPVYTAQKKSAGRVSVTDQQVARAAVGAARRAWPPACPGGGRDRAAGRARAAARRGAARPAAAERRGLRGAARRRRRRDAASWTTRCSRSSTVSERDRSAISASPPRGHRRAAAWHRARERARPAGRRPGPVHARA